MRCFIAKSILILLTVLILPTMFFTGCGVTGNSESVEKKDKDNAGTWNVIHKIDVEQATEYAGFLDENYGITVGGDGVTFYTNDGGTTWNVGNNTSSCRYGLAIVDKNVAWSGGRDGNIRVTKDGAKNWSETGNFNSDEYSLSNCLSFVDENVGWIANTGWTQNADKLVYTKDGGKSWNNADLPSGCKKISAIHFRTAEEGYVLDNKGMIYLTKDAAKTWSNIKCTSGDVKVYDLSAPTAAIRFSDDKNGFVVMYTEDGKIIARRTSDGGSTWEDEALPQSQCNLFFISPDGKFLTMSNPLKQIVVLKYE